ncbi:hypothetical protein ACFVIM_12335 [Streptomyces sp. NPDC057638]|uniref:hypothetical protein n=1 Tax=Streptomyces sp. NPDC057638 TaxID=3346190 RepID=UPI0036C72786
MANDQLTDRRTGVTGPVTPPGAPGHRTPALSVPDALVRTTPATSTEADAWIAALHLQ